MSLGSILSYWRSNPRIAENIVVWQTDPPRPPQLEPFPQELHPDLQGALHQRGIRSLYAHQASAWRRTQAGKHVVIVTGTASGKTLCYNLPVLDNLLRDDTGRALYLFPTKALAQDQLKNLHDLTSSSAGLPIATYDGDTPNHSRSTIRSKSRLIISNPDMLHAGILPHHTNWVEFFGHLHFVVIDEIHTYRGVFGSHVANVIRRLKRIARHYGAAPQFILTSATIGNPDQLGEWLVEEPVERIDNDGAARGARHFLIYNPPVVDRELGLRRSMAQETVNLAADLLAYNVQTIIFGRSRRTVELMLTYLRQESASRPPFPFYKSLSTTEDTLAEKNTHEVDPLLVRGYRSGYLPQQRREIESGMRNGAVRAVVATNALELGIDIGGLGAALLAGYPGSIAATWQQAGRAGRGIEEALAILITSASPLDQFLAHHPDYFFERIPEQALINPDNLLILLEHIRCAAFELPFRTGETFGKADASQVLEILEFLRTERVLYRSGDKYFWMADRYAAQAVSLRSTSPEIVALQTPSGSEWQTFGQVDLPSAGWFVHPGAIYMHEAQTYLVRELDLDGKIARLEPVDTDYYTEPQSETTVTLQDKLKTEEAIGGIKGFGELQVVSQIKGFRKIRMHTHETLGTGEIHLPPSELQTQGYWLALSDGTVRQLEESGLWTNSPNDYGPGWNAQRELVRARDRYRCQVCGIPEQGKAHHVHHKAPFRSFPNAELANQLANLITLCPSCHRRAETAVRIRSGLAGLANVLGNLAPFFLMCDTRDLGVHSDPEASLADGQPAVVIYDRVPAGIGFAERLYEIHDQLIESAYELVSACQCADGCPSCVGPGGEAGAGGKREAFGILELIKKPAES